MAGSFKLKAALNNWLHTKSVELYSVDIAKFVPRCARLTKLMVTILKNILSVLLSILYNKTQYMCNFSFIIANYFLNNPHSNKNNLPLFIVS